MNMEVFNKDPGLMNSLMGEIKITLEVNSDFTVKMLHYTVGNRYTYIILELCDSDLSKRLSQSRFT